MNWRTARKHKLRRDREHLEAILTLRGMARLFHGDPRAKPLAFDGLMPVFESLPVSDADCAFKALVAEHNQRVARAYAGTSDA